MNLDTLDLQDPHVSDGVEKTCARIRARFSSATFSIRAHPTHRGAIIDAHVPTEDDFEVLDIVNPELDDLLVDEDIAIYVRVCSV